MLGNCWGFNCAAKGMRNIQVNESEDFLWWMKEEWKWFKGIRLAGFEKQISPPSPIKKEQLPIYNHREVPAAAGSSFYNHRELLARSSLLFENDISSKLANVSRYVFDSLPLHFIPVKAQSTYFLYISSNISISFILFSHTNPKIFPNFTLVQV